jgi:hypothetical protein
MAERRAEAEEAPALWAGIKFDCEEAQQACSGINREPEGDGDPKQAILVGAGEREQRGDAGQEAFEEGLTEADQRHKQAAQ